ncbi:MAG: acyl-CoA thioesterase [Cytophagaceae bacterium]|nr:acyl-CoA thioesterase [Cytophagaceae bacterium]
METLEFIKSPYSFQRVRFQDCDPLGHLNNARYIDYALNAREDHLREFYQIQISDFLKQGLGWVVNKHEIQYLKPAYYNENLKIISGLIDVLDQSVLVEVRLYDEQQQLLKCIVWTHYTLISTSTAKKERIPDNWRAFFEARKQEEVHALGGITSRIAQLFPAKA